MQSKNTPKRTDVLCSLNNICKQLEEWAVCKKPVLSIRVNLLRAAIYGYSVMLSGLKDEELELRIIELEDKMKNGVLIVREKHKKKN
jgi:hypothetical protein